MENLDLESLNLENLNISTKNITLERIIEFLTTSGAKLLIGFIIISIGFKIINKFVNRFICLLEKRNVEITIRKFLKSLLSTLFKVLLLMPVLNYWGVQLTGITAIFASAGVAIGLALQGSLSNFAGGFIILFLRPFKVGDYIQTSGYEGTVEKIDLFYTHLATVDNKEVLIPNGILSNGSLINYSAKDTRRVDLKFGVSYEDDILHVRRVLNDIVSKHELILNHPEPFIGIVEHANSSVNFAVRVWCKTSDYWKIYFDLLEEVKLRFDEEKISIPYPQMDLNVKKDK